MRTRIVLWAFWRYMAPIFFPTDGAYRVLVGRSGQWPVLVASKEQELTR